MIEQIAFMALGAVVGTLFWIYALGLYFPKKFQTAEDRIDDKIDAKEVKYMAKIEEKEKKYLDKIDNIVAGKDEIFNKVFDDKIPEIVEKFKEHIPNNDQIIDGLIDKFSGPPSDKMIAFMKQMTQAAYYSTLGIPGVPNSGNAEIKRSIQGHINGYVNTVTSNLEGRLGFSEVDMKGLKELIAFFNANKEKLGMLAGAGGGGEGGAFNPLQMMGMFIPGMGKQ